MNQFIIRGATHFDLEAIHEIELASFPEDPWSRAALESEILGPARAYFVAERITPINDAKEIIGYAGILAPLDSDADIATIAVKSCARGLGVGRALMDALLSVAKDRHCERVHLEVRVDNEVAKNLYRSLGFTDVRIRKGYYEGGKVDALSMLLELGDGTSEGEEG